MKCQPVLRIPKFKLIPQLERVLKGKWTVDCVQKDKIGCNIEKIK